MLRYFGQVPIEELVHLKKDHKDMKSYKSFVLT